MKKALKYGHRKLNHETESFLEELPSNLRTELSYKMYNELATSIDFLKKRPKKFIASIGPLLRQIQTAKGEIIVSQGDYANEMYFIKKGLVSVVVKEKGNFKFMSISQGYYFGEVFI